MRRGGERRGNERRGEVRGPDITLLVSQESHLTICPQMQLMILRDGGRGEEERREDR